MSYGTLGMAYESITILLPSLVDSTVKYHTSDNILVVALVVACESIANPVSILIESGNRDRERPLHDPLALGPHLRFLERWYALHHGAELDRAVPCRNIWVSVITSQPCHAGRDVLAVAHLLHGMSLAWA